MISSTNAELDSENDRTEHSDSHPNERALVVRSPEIGTLTPYLPNGGIGGAYMDGTPQGLSMAQLFNALRRRWLLALLAGLLLGLPLAAIVWLVTPENYEVQATLRVGDVVSYRDNTMVRDPNAYEQYRKTQAAMIKSRLVLAGALREEGIMDLPIIHAEKGTPQQFLEDEVSVVAPLGTEVLWIKMRGRDAQQLVKIVNAIKESYFKNVVNLEKTERLQAHDMLDSKLREQQNDLTAKRNQYQTLKKTTGTQDDPTKDAQRLLLDQQLTTLNQQKTAKETEISNIDAQLLTQKIRTDNKAPPPAWLVDRLMEQDQQVMDLEKALQSVQAALDQARSSVRNPAHDSTVKDLSGRLAGIKSQLDNRRSDLMPKIVEQLKLTGPGQTTTELTTPEELKAKRTALADELTILNKQFEQAAQARVGLINESAQLQQLKADITEREAFVGQLKTRLDQTDIELNMPPRVSLLEAAYPPEGASAVFRILIAVFAGIAGLVVGSGAVVGVEYQAHRLSTAGELSSRTGLRVLGTVPNLAALSQAKGLNGSAALAGILAESVDSIRTMLLQQSRDDAPHVIMVTSAGDREGKTTVASHLAASLARSGRRTLLVDGDLRAPTAHAMFSAALNPGLCEVLRGEVVWEAAIQPTNVDSLMLVAAGLCDYQAIAALSHHSVSELFEKAREQFEFVVIDAAPVLTYADTLLMGGHVDAAVISVRRDVSQLHKVYEARERMESVGIRVLGAVVNGISETRRRPAYALPSPT